MRVPQWVARFNRRYTNRAALPVVGHLPALGILEHVGRRTGHRYRTPLLVFTTDDGFAILVGYGPQTQWLRNVQAGGPTSIYKHGRSVAVGNPVLKDKKEVAGRVARSSRWFYRLFPYDESVLVLTRLTQA
jgi:deazaflavin-dependent oxidoreductase (nitroreductase family)